MIRLHSPTPGRDGQAMTEFIIWAFVLLLLLQGTIWFGKTFETKLQSHMAARYLAWANAATHDTDLDSGEIMARAQAYYPLSDRNPFYNDSSSSVWSGSGIAEAGLEPEGGGGPTDGGLDIFGAVDSMMSVASNSHGFVVGGTYAPGGILDQTIPDGSRTFSGSYVSGGTWHKKQINGDVVISGVKAALFLWSSYALSQY